MARGRFSGVVMTALAISCNIKQVDLFPWELPMSVTIEFSTPEEEAAFQARANAEGLTVEQWLIKIGRERACQPEERFHERRPRNLAELLRNSPFAGSDLDLGRAQDYPRPAGLE
jgi:hypothetical protein